VDVKQLRYFLQVVERKSFTKAAEQIGIAQPALGFQIRKLEEELQVQLLVRNSRGVLLTEAGQYLVTAARRILVDVATTSRHLVEMGGAPRGEIRLGITPSFSQHLIIPLIEHCRRELPQVGIGFFEELSAILTEWIEDNRIDLALAFNVPPTRGLKVQQLATDHLCLITAAKQRSEHPDTVDFAEVAALPLILPPKPHRLRKAADDAAYDRKLKLNITYEVQSIPTILLLIENGMGATLMSSAAISRRLPNGKLSSRRVVNPSLQSVLSLVHSDDRPLSRVELHLIEVLKRILAQGDLGDRPPSKKLSLPSVKKTGRA
jgi:LysR family nitrogen assimilation transcriptional regulator